jgi:Immunity protein 8
MDRKRTRGHSGMTLVRPFLRRIHSPDIENLSNAAIDSSRPFEVYIQAMFGPEGKDGEESFGFIVCNEAWLSTQSLALSDLPANYLVIQDFDYNTIVRKLEDIALRCSGDTRAVAAEKLSHFGAWEFDGYRP